MSVLALFLKIVCGILVFVGFAYAEIKKDIQTFSADFTQTLRSAESGENGEKNQIYYKGTIKALAPFNVLWIYTEPIPKEIYINHYLMVIYEPKLKQAIITRFKENMDLLSLIKNAKEISKNHYEADVGGQKYDLEFENGILKGISFIDGLDNHVEIAFTNITLNQNIDPKLFDFAPSSETDVIYH